MKKILLALVYFISTASMLHAQDNKPTKEQTQQYIQNILSDYYCYFDFDMTQDGFGIITHEHKVLDVEFNDCTFTIKTQYKRTAPSSHQRDALFTDVIVINLKDVEAIESVPDRNMDNHIIRFIAFNKSKLISITTEKVKDGTKTISKNYEPKSEDIHVPENEWQKIVSAFNYLRKLCGAPDPLKF